MRLVEVFDIFVRKNRAKTIDYDKSNDDAGLLKNQKNSNLCFCVFYFTILGK
jgi:hypothetical protein